MLYLGTALKSTAITHAITIPNLLSSSSLDIASSVSSTSSDEPPSLVVAKGNLLEIHHPTESGLVKVGETEVWGMIIGLEWVLESGKPGIVVMTDHPIARLLLYTIHTSSSSSHAPLPNLTLHLSSVHDITRPSSRPAEFFTGLVADREQGIVVGSLYTGVLTVVEVRIGKESGGMGKGKRKQGMGMGKVEEEELGELGFGEVYEINIREHNLLSLAFLIPRTTRRSSIPSSRRNHTPILNFLFLTPQYTLQLIPRRLNRTKRIFEDLASSVDLLSGKGFVPAAKKLVSVRGGVVVVGDEWSKLFEMGFVSGIGTSPSISGKKSSGTRRESMTSPTSKMSTLSTSPESEKKIAESNKRRKGSVGGSVVPNVGSGVGSGQSIGGSTVMGSETTFAVREGWRVRQGFGEISAATVISSDDGKQALFLGDDFGKLTMIQFEIGKKDSAIVSSMGVTSAPTAICHIDGPYIFIASQCGDSQLIAIESPSSKGKAKQDDSMQVDEEAALFKVLENLSNIGPVNDFCVVDDEGGGSSQLVTASGLSSTGSLRTIRSGLGTNDLAVIEGLEDITDLYTVQSKSLHLLFASSLSTTRIFQIDASTAGEFSLRPVSDRLAKASTMHRTIAVAPMWDFVLIQVTNVAVHAINTQTGEECGRWSQDHEGDELVQATFATPYVVLATGKGELYTLTMAEDGSIQNAAMASKSDALCEVSCLAAGLIDGSAQPLVAICRWGSNEVSLFAMPDLRMVGEPKYENSHPVSVRIHDSQVLVGLGNGTLVTYDIKSPDGPELGARRVLTLGIEPLLLASCSVELEIEGGKQIVALAERVSVIYSERGRMLASSISGKGVTAVTSLHLPSIGSCIVLASAEGLIVKQVTSLKQLQMRKVELGYDTPVGIAHHRGLQAYGVSINRTTLELELGNEERSSFFRLYDDTNLRPVAEIPLPPREEVVSLNLVTLSDRTYFSLGTVLPAIPTDVNSVPRGFVRLIEGVNDETFGYKLDPVAEMDVGGPVRDSKAIWDQLVVAVDNRVELLSFSSLASDPQSALTLTSSWGNAFFASCLTVQQISQRDGTIKERLHVGDGMRSVFALERNGKGELQDVGRDIKPHWVLTMEELESQGGGVIFADTSYNLLTIRHKDNHLENAAGIALHETAARFRKGTFAPSYAKREVIRPEVLFATTSGALGVVADLGDTESKILSDLQRNMDEVCSGPGITWRAYREIHTEGSGKPRNTLGFIDGDFVKRFLDLSTDDKGLDVTRVLAGSNDFERVGLGVGKGGGPVEAVEVVRILEAAGSLH